MNSRMELAITAAKGVAHLFIGKVIARVVGMLGGLILIRLLTPEDYGFIAIAMVAPGVFGLIGSLFGGGPAIIKYLAEYKSKGELETIKRFAYSGFIFFIGISTVLTITCYLFAGDFASAALGKPYMTPLIKVSSLFILTSALYFFAESIFIGLDATRAYAILMILYESLVKILPIILVIKGLEVWGALFGMVLAEFITGLVGVVVSIHIVAKMSKESNPSFNSKAALKKILVYGVPLGITDLLSVGLGNFYGIMIAAYCVPADIGNYSVADAAVSSLSYLTIPIFTVLFPMFSKVDATKEPALLIKLYDYSVKYSSFLILPTVMLLAVMAKPLTVFLFGAQYEGAWVYLMFLALTWLTFGLGRSHLWKLLTGQGKTKLIAELDGLTVFIAICLGLVLIPAHGIIGLIATSFTAGWPSYFIALGVAHRNHGIKPPLRNVWRIYVSTIAATLPIIPVLVMLSNDVVKIVVSVAVGLGMYIIVAPLIKAIKENDIDFLIDAVKPQPLIGTVVCKILQVMRRMTKLRTL